MDELQMRIKDIKAFVTIYHFFADRHGKGPASPKELTDFAMLGMANAPQERRDEAEASFRKLTDGSVVFVWNVDLRANAEHLDKVALAYEPTSNDDSIVVGFANGEVKLMPKAGLKLRLITSSNQANME